MASLKFSLKLLVDKQSQIVLFAEASKDFVDFLLHIFSLPLGTLIKLLGSAHMVGCLGKLKDSIDNFIGASYLQPGIKKDDIFSPKTPYTGNALLMSDVSSSYRSDASKAIYRCGNASTSTLRAGYQGCQPYATLNSCAYCPNCSGGMCYDMKRVLSKKEEADDVSRIAMIRNDYVKEAVSYMVMDDLAVKPISSITLLNSFNDKDLSQIEEKTVSFGKNEALKLLKASLVTDKVLTTLFMHNNA